MDEYWILARRKERLDKLVEKYENKKVVANVHTNNVHSRWGFPELLLQRSMNLHVIDWQTV